MQFIDGKTELSSFEKEWLLKRIEHFMALYESGKMKPSDVCYKVYRGFTICGAIPEEHQKKEAEA